MTREYAEKPATMSRGLCSWASRSIFVSLRYSFGRAGAWGATGFLEALEHVRPDVAALDGKACLQQRQGGSPSHRAEADD